MKPLCLRRVDDARCFIIESSGQATPTKADGETAYNAGYRRIVGEPEVPPGRARIFETGGDFVLVVRQQEEVLAFDAEPLIPAERTPHLLRAQQFVIEPLPESANQSQRLQPMAVTIENGWIWVDVGSVSS